MVGGPAAEPVVSVVIPIYNTVEYLDSALESIRQQTLSDIEIICVDDASTDGSADTIASHAKDDGRIRLISLPVNRGQGAAREAGVAAATGEYLYFFDSDDRLAPEALAQVSSLMHRDQLDIAYFDAVPFSDSAETEELLEGYRRYYRRKSAYDGVVSGRALFAAMAANDDWKPSLCIQLIRRGLVEDHAIHFVEDIFHEDQIYSFRLAFAAARVSYLADAYFERRLRGGSTVTSEPTARHVAGLLESYAQALTMADAAGATPGTRLGASVAFEMGKTFDDGLAKYGRLSVEDRAAVRERLDETFVSSEIIKRVRLETELQLQALELHRIQEELAHASGRIVEYQTKLWRRAARRLHGRLARLRRG